MNLDEPEDLAPCVIIALLLLAPSHACGPHMELPKINDIKSIERILL